MPNIPATTPKNPLTPLVNISTSDAGGVGGGDGEGGGGRDGDGDGDSDGDGDGVVVIGRGGGILGVHVAEEEHQRHNWERRAEAAAGVGGEGVAASVTAGCEGGREVSQTGVNKQ